MLDASGLAGNECAPDLDLSAIEVQQITVGESFSIDLLAAGATVTDLDAQGNPTGDSIRFLLDPDVPVDTPVGASITEDGVFTWTPAADQVGDFEIVVIVIDQGAPPLADAETFTISVIESSNESPDLDLNGSEAGSDFQASFIEDGGPVFIVSETELSITDGDSAELTGSLVTITNLLDGSNEALSVDTTGTLITSEYNETTGELTLSGTDTVANYEQVLRTLSYCLLYTSPSPRDRQKSRMPSSA